MFVVAGYVAAAIRSSEPMKVIFLDIDGVLNCDKTPNPRKFPYVVDKKLLRRLKKLLDRTGCHCRKLNPASK